MIVWTFVILLCCPGDQSHTITWQTATKAACEQMQRTLVSQVRQNSLNATVGACEERVAPKP